MLSMGIDRNYHHNSCLYYSVIPKGKAHLQLELHNWDLCMIILLISKEYMASHADLYQ